MLAWVRALYHTNIRTVYQFYIVLCIYTKLGSASGSGPLAGMSARILAPASHFDPSTKNPAFLPFLLYFGPHPYKIPIKVDFWLRIFIPTYNVTPNKDNTCLKGVYPSFSLLWDQLWNQNWPDYSMIIVFMKHCISHIDHSYSYIVLASIVRSFGISIASAN